MSSACFASAIFLRARSTSRCLPATIASLITFFSRSISRLIRFALTSRPRTSFTYLGSSRYMSFRSPLDGGMTASFLDLRIPAIRWGSPTASFGVGGGGGGSMAGGAAATGAAGLATAGGAGTSSEKGTPHGGQRFASAATVDRHTGHSNSAAPPSSNRAPHVGHVDAFEATGFSQTGQMNWSPAGGAGGLAPATAPGFPGGIVTTLVRASKISEWPWSPEIDARISSRLLESFTWTSAISTEDPPLTSKRLRSVWQNSHRRAPAGIAEAHTGQTLVSLGGVDAHLETQCGVPTRSRRTKIFRYRCGE